MRWLIVLGVLGCSAFGSAVASHAADEPAKESKEPADDARIIGTWKLVSKTQKGVQSKPDDAGDNAPLDVTFEEQSWKTHIGPKGAALEITGGYSLDPNQTPKLLDITVRADGNSIDVYSIYKFEKDQLYIRIREGNGTRPADFDSLADDCITLVFDRDGK